MHGHRFDTHGFSGSEWLQSDASDTTDSETPKAGEVLFEAGLTFAIALSVAAAVCLALLVFGIQ